jgi:hypothetical protein
MLQRLSIFAILLTLALRPLLAQDGKLAGKVLDRDGAPLGFASVVVYSGDLVRYGTQTDAAGTFSIQPVTPGEYRVEARYLGAKKAIEGVSVITGQTRDITINFSDDISSTLDSVVIYEERPFEKDPVVATTLTNSEVKNIGTRDVQSFAALTAGVFQADEGETVSIRGARNTATVYYIDGVKVRGQTNLPQASIAQLQVITGGTPAEFGDFTGGVINITTANPTPNVSGGVELLSSQFLDNFGTNLAAVSLSGPLITRTRYLEDTDTKFKSSILSFFLNGEYDYNLDSDPAARGIFRLRDGVLADLQQTPVIISEDGISFRSRANFITGEDFETIPTKVNNSSLRLRLLGRLDFQPADNILIKVGGNVEDIQLDNWSIGNMLFAPDPQDQFQGRNYRAWFRFQQSFPGGRNSTIKNLFYSIQGDYSLYQRRFQNTVHRDNFFDYGHVGSFEFDEVPIYGFSRNPNDPDISSGDYWRTLAYTFNNLRFDGSDSRNPLLANYNTAILDYVGTNGVPNLGFVPTVTDPPSSTWPTSMTWPSGRGCSMGSGRRRSIPSSRALAPIRRATRNSTSSSFASPAKPRRRSAGTTSRRASNSSNAWSASLAWRPAFSGPKCGSTPTFTCSTSPTILLPLCMRPMAPESGTTPSPSPGPM